MSLCLSSAPLCNRVRPFPQFHPCPPPSEMKKPSMGGHTLPLTHFVPPSPFSDPSRPPSGGRVDGRLRVGGARCLLALYKTAGRGWGGADDSSCSDLYSATAIFLLRPSSSHCADPSADLSLSPSSATRNRTPSFGSLVPSALAFRSTCLLAPPPVLSIAMASVAYTTSLCRTLGKRAHSLAGETRRQESGASPHAIPSSVTPSHGQQGSNRSSREGHKRDGKGDNRKGDRSTARSKTIRRRTRGGLREYKKG